MKDLNFYYFSSKFIKQSFVGTVLPSIRHSQISEGEVIHDPTHISFMQEHPAPMPQSLLEIVLFSVMDSIVDARIPSLTNASFSKRYSELPSVSELDVVFKEVYRVLKMIRNAAVHNNEAISRGNNDFKINYVYRKTEFRLECNTFAVQDIYGLCLLFIENINVQDKYFSLVVSYCFNRFLSGVRSYNDDYGCISSKVGCDENFHFYDRFRYRVSFEELNKEHDSIVIARKNGIYKYYLEDEKRMVEYANCDEYLIENKMGETYLIPGHILDNDGRVKLDEFNSWKVGPKYFGKKREF